MSDATNDRPPDLAALLALGRYQEILDSARTEDGAVLVSGPDLALTVATAATRLGHIALGEELASKAALEFRARADDDGRLRSCNLLGAIAYERGLTSDAAARWEETLQLARTLGDTTMVARACNNLATTHYFAARTEDAHSLYREALQAYQRLGDRRGLAEVLHNQAILLRASGQTEPAAELGLEAVRHAESVDDPVLLGLMLAGRAETLIEQDEVDLAIRFLDRAAGLCRLAGDPVGGAEVDRIRALAALRAGQPAEALAIARRAKEVALSHGIRLLEGEAETLIGGALQRLGMTMEAGEAYARARSIFLDIGAVLWLGRLPAAE